MTRVLLPHHAVALLLLSALLLVGPAAAQVAGDPILTFGQPFAIYSDTYESYCQLGYVPYMFLMCNLTVRDPVLATPMVVLSGSQTGYVSYNDSSSQVQLRTFNPTPTSNGTYCIASVSDPTYSLRCNSTVPITSQEAFFVANIIPRADGYVHIGPSEVSLKSKSTGYCSAQPNTYNNGFVQCNRASVGSWETYHFVPV